MIPSTAIAATLTTVRCGAGAPVTARATASMTARDRFPARPYDREQHRRPAGWHVAVIRTGRRPDGYSTLARAPTARVRGRAAGGGPSERLGQAGTLTWRIVLTSRPRRRCTGWGPARTGSAGGAASPSGTSGWRPGRPR